MLRSYMDRVVDPVSIFWTAVRQGDSDLGPQSVDCPGRADRLPRIAANRARLPAVRRLRSDGSRLTSIPGQVIRLRLAPRADRRSVTTSANIRATPPVLPHDHT